MPSLTGSGGVGEDVGAHRHDSSALCRQVEAVCDRIEKVDSAVRAFVAEPGRRTRLRAEALAVSGRWPQPRGRPPLFGMAVGVKDIVRVDGLPTGAGSDLPAEELAGAQASLVTRLQTAGALVAGKTVTAEFAVSAAGPTRNPRHLAHTPGGSSSGSAAAVAARMVPVAIGTQTVGSMIRPAAYCGVVGFAATQGRVPTDGVIANAPTLDTVGVFAADVAAVALTAAVLCDAWRSAAPPAAETVVGIPVGPYLARATPEALAVFDGQVGRLRAAGLRVRSVPVLEDLEEVVRQLFVLDRYELARTHARWFAQFGDRYRPETARAIREGRDVTDRAYEMAVGGRLRFRCELVGRMAEQGLDAWVAPSATGPAPVGLASTGDPVMSLPWSWAGLPVVGLPAGRAGNGLPLGLQCIGRPGMDEELLALAPVVAAALSSTVPARQAGLRKNQASD